jgi:predicted NAD/FAD-binding protein
MKQIAVIGGGVAGLTAAYYLREIAEVTVYEANEYLGGHTQTHVIAMDGKTQPVDTGFIVYNDRTYPQFEALLDRLGCEGQKTEMSFSLKRPCF